MTPEGFYNHRKHLKLKLAPFARELGITWTTAKAYETGKSRIPQHIELAIQAIRYRVLERLCEEILEVFKSAKQ